MYEKNNNTQNESILSHTHKKKKKSEISFLYPCFCLSEAIDLFIGQPAVEVFSCRYALDVFACRFGSDFSELQRRGSPEKLL